jgi:phenylacetate-CoA ligase
LRYAHFGDVTASTAGTKATIVHGLRARLGAQVSVTVDEVKAIPPEASGKYRYVVSKVAT